MTTRIEFSDERFRIIFNNTYSWDNWISNDGVLLWVNLAVEKFIGFTVEECHQIAEFPFCLISPEEKTIKRRKIRKKLRAGKPAENIELKIIRKDRSTAWMLSTWKPVISDQNERIGTWITFHDITQLKNAEVLLKSAVEKLKSTNLKLKHARKKAEDATEAQSIFLSNTSHEIRTPMNVITGVTELLKQTSLNTHQSQLVSVIEQSTSHLLRIINDVLDISKMESGELVFEKIPFLPKHALSEVTSSLKNEAEKKGLHFETVVSQSLDEMVVKGDPVRFKQILFNLADNAIKFTDNGTVRITLQLVRRKGRQVTLSTEVSDTGIGISPEQQKLIFQRFVQGDASTTRKYGGTGLGLAIVQQLTVQMGGNIQVDSVPGKSTVFSVVLPFQTVTRKPSAPAMQLGQQFKLQDVHVLVAEDNTFNQLIMKSFLEEINCTVDLAANGWEVLEKVSKTSYDLIMMDIQMPGLDGVETTCHIRNSPEERIRDIPIIAVTANVLKKKVAEYLRAGMNDYLFKPLNPFDVHEKIKQHVDPARIKTRPEQPMIDVSRIRKIAGADDGFFRNTLQLFQKNLESLQGDLLPLIHSGDGPEAASLVHRVKPSVAYLGWDDLYDQLEVLEKKLKSGADRQATISLAERIVGRVKELIPEITGMLEERGERREEK